MSKNKIKFQARYRAARRLSLSERFADYAIRHKSSFLRWLVGGSFSADFFIIFTLQMIAIAVLILIVGYVI